MDHEPCFDEEDWLQFDDMYFRIVELEKMVKLLEDRISEVNGVAYEAWKRAHSFV